MAKGDSQTTNQNQQQSSVSANAFDTAVKQLTQQQQQQQQTQTGATNTTTAGQTNPWDASQPLVKSLLDKYGNASTDVTPEQQSAIDAMSSAAGGIPNFGGSASDAVTKLFGSSTAPQVGMLSSALDQLKGNIGGTASGAELDPYKTPGFSDALSTTMNDITNRVKSVYAGSGRDPSGAGSFAKSLGRGLTEGISPLISSQFNTNKTNQMNAANTLFGSAGSTAGAITGQQQIPLANAAQAVGMLPQVNAAYTAPGAAQFSIADLMQSLPFNNLQKALQPTLGLAGLGSSTTGTQAGATSGTGTGTTTGTTQGTTDTSGTGNSATFGTGTGQSTTTQPQSLLSNILGGLTGGAGLLSAIGGSGGAAAGLSSLMALSDERAKENIQPVGMLNDGQKIYRYRMRGSPKTEIGLIAQNVEKSLPDAVHEVGGLKMLDYRKATNRAAQMEAA